MLCELPTQRFWGVLQKGVKQTLNQANAQAVDIKAMGYSSKANTFVLLDAEDKPLSPLVFWTDGRAKEIFPEVKQLWQRDDFLQTTGLGLAVSPQFCLSKLAWFRDNQSQLEQWCWWIQLGFRL